MDKELIAAWDARFPDEKARAIAIASIVTLSKNTEYLSRDAVMERAEKIVNELIGDK